MPINFCAAIIVQKPAVVRYCSKEAAKVLEQSMASVTDYMAPECEMDYKHMTFKTRKSEQHGSPQRRELAAPGEHHTIKIMHNNI